MHGVQIMYQGFHGLVGLSDDLSVGKESGLGLQSGYFLGCAEFLQSFGFYLHIVVVPCHARADALFRFDLFAEGFHFVSTVFHIKEKLQHFSHVGPVQFFVGLSDSWRDSIVEVRDGLAAMLVVLVGLDGDTCQCSVAFDVVWLSEMAVTCWKSALKQFNQINLAAGHGQRVEIHVMDVNVAAVVSLGIFRIYDIHLIKLFGAFGAILQHGSHGCVAVDVGVFTFDVYFFCLFKGQILVDMHQLGVHASDACTFSTVQYIFLGCSCMTVFNKYLFHRVLYLLYSRGVVVADLQQVELYLSCKIWWHFSVTAAQHFGGVEYGIGYLFHVKFNHSAVSFNDSFNVFHRLVLLLRHTRYSIFSFLPKENYTINKTVVNVLLHVYMMCHDTDRWKTKDKCWKNLCP